MAAMFEVTLVLNISGSKARMRALTLLGAVTSLLFLTMIAFALMMTLMLLSALGPFV